MIKSMTAEPTAIETLRELLESLYAEQARYQEQADAVGRKIEAIEIKLRKIAAGDKLA